MSYQLIWKRLKATRLCKIECSSDPKVLGYISRKVSKIKDRDWKFKDQSGGIYKLVYEPTPQGMEFRLDRHKWALSADDYAEIEEGEEAELEAKREELLKIATKKGVTKI
jgi:hypothetical protein